MSPQEKAKSRRVESYILARRSPWLLWRALAYEKGYVPPLLENEFSEDIPLQLHCQGLNEGPRLLKAGPSQTISTRTEQVGNGFARHAVAFLLGLAIALASIGFFKAATTGNGFKIPAVSQYVGK